MKIKIIPMFFITLMLLIISFSDNAHAKDDPPDDPPVNEIKVSILFGGGTHIIDGAQWEKQEECLKDYKWSVNDDQDEYKVYKFNFKKWFAYYEDKYRDYYLDNNITDVLILAGTTKDMVRCIWRKDFREQYANYIFQGGGLIAECGGGSFPLPHKDPRTLLEWGFIYLNSFLPEMNTKVYVKMDYPIFSEFIGVKYSEVFRIYRPYYRKAPEAIGIEAYNVYNLTSPLSNY